MTSTANSSSRQEYLKFQKNLTTGYMRHLAAKRYLKILNLSERGISANPNWKPFMENPHAGIISSCFTKWYGRLRPRHFVVNLAAYQSPRRRKSPFVAVAILETN